MKETETWTLSVDAKVTNKFNLKLRAKKFFFPDFYQLSFKLKTHPRASSLKKSKTLKSKFINILKKCRFKYIKKTGIGANSNSTSRCISSAGPSSGNVAKFKKWIASGDNYWIVTAKRNNFNWNAAVGFLYKMFAEQALFAAALPLGAGDAALISIDISDVETLMLIA
ncbi:hypothetical protein POM88_054209 [Heracleum sosnowskyi]|uniref:Uncharacterized protein n=1 Tax=Heracleum sosnowskyi TaxID=360622 RepID=A0AAD8GND8_9APIA|nr:hypothetical protein POM88_054209 [Heracleum sosnowskyi]